MGYDFTIIAVALITSLLYLHRTKLLNALDIKVVIQRTTLINIQ